MLQGFMKRVLFFLRRLRKICLARAALPERKRTLAILHDLRTQNQGKITYFLVVIAILTIGFLFAKIDVLFKKCYECGDFYVY